MDAFYEGITYADDISQSNVGAALRALAERINGAEDIRQDILAIAAELEALPND